MKLRFKKEDLNKENLKTLALSRAYLFQKRENYEEVAKNLLIAAPLMKNKEGKAKIFFILGQINQ